MRNYYFIVPSLPPLSLDVRPELGFVELMERLRLGLTKGDWAQVELLRLFVDICNIRSFLMEEEIDPKGNLGEKEMDEALLVKTTLPPYVFDFLDPFATPKEKLRNFSGLIARFFQEEIARHTGFLKAYLTLERESRLVLLGLRAKKMGRDLARELQFEDPQDEWVVSLLAQKEAAQYDPPPEYQELKELMVSCGNDPLAEQKAFAEYRLRRIEQLAENEVFSIGQVLSYVARWMIVEGLFELDRDRGKMILDTFTSK
jgi:hypothetical protein